jgi:hypothetical protein
VIVIVVVVVVVAVIVIVIVIAPMSSALRVGMIVPITICTAFGLERRLLDDHRQPERAHHVVEHMIVLVAQPSSAHLHGNVAIAQVVRSARERNRIVRTECRHHFGRGSHQHHRAAARRQQIPVAQDVSARHLQRNLFARFELRPQPALASQLERQLQYILVCASVRRACRDPIHG